eukprot:522761-Rhodomonas_salina.1
MLEVSARTLHGGFEGATDFIDKVVGNLPAIVQSRVHASILDGQWSRALRSVELARGERRLAFSEVGYEAGCLQAQHFVASTTSGEDAESAQVRCALHRHEVEPLARILLPRLLDASDSLHSRLLIKPTTIRLLSHHLRRQALRGARMPPARS